MFSVKQSLLLVLGLTSSVAFASLEDAKRRCLKPIGEEPILYSNEFSWGFTVEGMNEKYNEIYASGKRLKSRAYYNPSTGKFVLPTTYGNQELEVEVPERFIKSIVQHIEEGLKRDYVYNVFFPDMGHAHYFIPQKYYDDIVNPLPVAKKKEKYEKILSAPGLKILYHTAEQLAMKDMDTKELYDNDITRWRYYTRNLVGYTDGTGKVEIHKLLNGSFNTVREYEGGDYKYWGAGFDLSASKDGCFAFKTKSGETQYFDISLESLPYQTSEHDHSYDGY